jgi:sulfur carrier protein ThiS
MKQTKEQNMTNRVTVAEMMAALSKMPQNAFVTVEGSYETYDGFSHPEVVMDVDGEVVVREAGEPDDYDDGNEDRGLATCRD